MRTYRNEASDSDAFEAQGGVDIQICANENLIIKDQRWYRMLDTAHEDREEK